MSTLKCSASLETASWFGCTAGLFVFHLSCSISFMCFNQPCIWIYERHISQEMHIMSAVLLRERGTSLKLLLDSFLHAPRALAVFQDAVQDQCTLNGSTGGKTHSDPSTDCVNLNCRNVLFHMGWSGGAPSVILSLSSNGFFFTAH